MADRALRYKKSCSSKRLVAPRPTTAERGYDYRWQQVRLAVLNDVEREVYIFGGPSCVMCEVQGMFVPAIDVDHIKPHRGDDELRFDPSNLRSLCKKHHGWKSATRDRRR